MQTNNHDMQHGQVHVESHDEHKAKIVQEKRYKESKKAAEGMEDRKDSTPISQALDLPIFSTICHLFLLFGFHLSSSCFWFQLDLMSVAFFNKRIEFSRR